MRGNNKGLSWVEIIFIILLMTAVVLIIIKLSKGSVDKIFGLADLPWEKAGG